jgi:hypothetical protein
MPLVCGPEGGGTVVPWLLSILCRMSMLITRTDLASDVFKPMNFYLFGYPGRYDFLGSPLMM